MRISDWSSDVCSSDLLGLFRQPYRGLEGRRQGVALTAESRRLACEAAAKACVLLKNDGVLPLTREGRTIALVGPLADSRSEEHTSELQSLMRISYAVFCLKNKKK